MYLFYNSLMNTILLILTGGTIGSEKKKNVVNVSKNNYLKSSLLKKKRKKINFKIVQPINILSENATPNNWNKIIKCIEENWNNKFSGIIITHGTDTLSYTSSALSQYFYNFYKPVILVSSDKPLKDKNSNGKLNFASAIDFIEKIKLPGTYVSYKNPKDNFISFFIGSRIKQINSYYNNLNSGFGDPFCILKNKKFSFIKKNNPSILSIKKNGKKNSLNMGFEFSNKILLIHAYPGLNYDSFNLIKIKPKVILHTLYHSGTSSLQFTDFIKKNKNKKISFFVAPISNKKKNIYLSLKILMKLKAKCLKGITVETAFAKLSLAFQSFKNEKDRNNFLSNNNFFEKILF